MEFENVDVQKIKLQGDDSEKGIKENEPSQVKEFMITDKEKDKSKEIGIETETRYEKAQTGSCFHRLHLHFQALLWKTLLLRVRSFKLLLFELLLPCIVVLVIAIVRLQASVQHQPTCHWPRQPLSSMGLYRFLQEQMCNPTMTCKLTPTHLDYDGDSNTPLDHLVNSLDELQRTTFISNILGKPDSANLVAEISHPPEDLITLYATVINHLAHIFKQTQFSLSTLCGTPGVKADFSCKHFNATRLKNFFGGTVGYFPSNLVSNEIIKHASTVYALIKDARNTLKTWSSSKLALEKFFKSAALNDLRTKLNACSTTNVNPNQQAACTSAHNFLLINKPNIVGPDSHWTVMLTNLDVSVVNLEAILSCFTLVPRFRPIATEQEFQAFLNEVRDSKVTNQIGLHFDNLPTNLTTLDPAFFSIKLRMRGDDIDRTNNFVVLDRYWIPQPRVEPNEDMLYFTSGFIDVQDLISSAILSISRSSRSTSPIHTRPFGVEMQMFPSTCHVDDSTSTFLATAIAQLMMPTWIVTIMFTVKFIVDEKESGLKEFTRVMGVKTFTHWLSWFVVTFLVMISTSAIMSLIMKYGKIFPKSDLTLIFFLFLSNAVATIGQTFLFSTLFTKATMGSVITALIYFALYLPVPLSIKNEDNISSWVPLVASLLAETSYGFGVLRLSRLEWQGSGGQWSLLMHPIFEDNLPTLGQCIYILWIDAFLYFILTWYIETVFPGKYGIGLPFYFPFTKSYWFGDLHEDLKGIPNSSQNINLSSPNFETEPTGLRVGVEVVGLTKQFGKNNIPVVNNLHINFYENQVTSFLGHNGAGKSTTMSMLIGLFPPTSGTAKICDYDLRKQLSIIRDNIGFCPQHNILFDYMTVEEHIMFYGQLKGLTKQQQREEAKLLTETLGLADKRKDLSKVLSGGQKRKLSVALAFVGGSLVVFLDEPTAGVDPYSRRSIWDMIIRMKVGRTVILTTHHMDEADILGDRIAVISQGKLLCCGTSLFLRDRYGTGYFFVFVIRSSDVSVEPITGFLQQFIPKAKLISVTSSELTYNIPAECAINGEFYKLFKKMEATSSGGTNKIPVELERLGVTSFGFSDTTLEEIFISVAEDPSGHPPLVDVLKYEKEQERRASLIESGRLPAPTLRSSLVHRTPMNNVGPQRTFEVDCKETISGCRFIYQQLRAMFSKRFHISRRDKLGFITQIVAPVVVVILSVGLITQLAFTNSFPAMNLHPWLVTSRHIDPPLQTFFQVSLPEYSVPTSTEQKAVNKAATQFQTIILSGDGWAGTRCVSVEGYSFQPGNVKGCLSSSGPLPKVLSQNQLHLAEGSSSIQCSCVKTGFFDCPCGALQPNPPPNFQYRTSDIVFNLTGYNISDYLTKSYLEAVRHRYGGVSFVQSGTAELYAKVSTILDTNGMAVRYLAWATATSGGKNTLWSEVSRFIEHVRPPIYYMRAWYNNEMYASAPVYLNMVNNLQLRMSRSGEATTMGIAVENAPLSLARSASSTDKILQQVVDASLAAFVILGLSFIPSSFVTFLVYEKQTGSKHLQLSSGLNPTVYWISNMIWDLILYLVPAMLCVLVFLAYGLDAYTSAENIGIFITLIILFGFAVTPMMYPAAFFFNNPSTAFVMMIVVNLSLGAGTVYLIFLLDMVLDSNPSLKAANNFFRLFFLIFPQYCLGGAIYDMAARYSKSLTNIPVDDAFSWDALGKNVIFLAVESLLFFSFVMLLEVRFFYFSMREFLFRKFPALSDKAVHKIKKRLSRADELDPKQLDEDVRNEMQHAYNTPRGSPGSPILVLNLTKFFGRKKLPSVKRLTFEVQSAECFGLLGVNGAGKTTTFRMLTSLIRPSMGQAFVNDYDVVNESKEARSSVGFCPQFDALHGKLTGRETLWMYARLRAIPEHLIESIVVRTLENMALTPHADKKTSIYSGGNKRKLSAAIATLGGPKVIFLDEPTSGMDPVGKRFLWKRIKELMQEGRTIVLTSHSMEECEALCTRIGIMLAGQFSCFGSVQHLKNLYGGGYTMDVRIKGANVTSEQVCGKIMSKFPNSKVNNLQTASHEYQFTSDLKLSELFQLMKEILQTEMIESFSVRQTTLDQVFVNFAKQQEGDEDSDDEESELNVPSRNLAV